MGDIKYISENVPHLISEVICVKCGKRWIAARPESTRLKQLECENCGAGFVIETGEVVELEVKDVQ